MLDPAQVDRRERWFVEGAAARVARLLQRAVELASEHGTPLSAFADQLRLPLPLLRAVLGEVVERPRLTLVQ